MVVKKSRGASGGTVTNDDFLRTPYSGYHHNDVPEEDVELTHVGPGTPAGEWLRRFWQPVVSSEELKDLPKAIRILGEDLVIFRDHSGQIGLLELHCSHRGTSLEFGQIEERGIRCCYHAWRYDVDGTILETPGEPAESTLKDRLRHGAYPTLEYKGLVFAYMGPPDERPDFPVLDMLELPGYRCVARMPFVWPCNWLQTRDNVVDPVHLHFLHTISGNEEFTRDFAHTPELDYLETPIGMVYSDTTRVGELVWVRVTDYIAPDIHQGCDLGEDVAQRDGNRPTMTSWAVPIDDTHTMLIGYWHYRESEEAPSKIGFGLMPERTYEERQRVPGDYDAMVGQRPIAIHALEHLGATDRGIIMIRNIMRRGIRAMQHGNARESAGMSTGEVIPTYAHERVLRIPPAQTAEEDRRLVRETGSRVVEDHIGRLAQR